MSKELESKLIVILRYEWPLYLRDRETINKLLSLIQAEVQKARQAGVIEAVRNHHKQYPNCPEPLKDYQPKLHEESTYTNPPKNIKQRSK